MKANLVVLFIITILISGCTEAQSGIREQDENDYIKERTVIIESSDKELNINLPNEDERVFIDLSYLESVYDISYKMRYTALDLYPDEEFTWWNYYTVDEFLSSEYYDDHFSSELDRGRNDIIISFGRKLKYLYYYEKDYLSDSIWQFEGYRARPVFESDYLQNSAYIYLINKTNLVDSELASDDMSSFLEGNIPFELPPIEEEINQTIKKHKLFDIVL